MSKDKRSSGRGVDAGASSAALSGPSIRKTAIRKTFLERLVFKADSMYTYGAELAKMLLDRGAPDEITQKSHDFLPALEKYRELFFALRDSGWAPAEKAPAKGFQEGDRVAVIKAHLPRYDFIAGLADGSTKLTAMRFIARGKSAKVYDVVVTDATTGVSYGLIPKAHLVGA
jgi:hypothetical protein